jgi:hypothetical protein
MEKYNYVFLRNGTIIIILCVVISVCALGLGPFPSVWQVLVSDWPTRVLAFELSCIAIRVDGLLKSMYRDKIDLARPLFTQILQV